MKKLLLLMVVILMVTGVASARTVWLPNIVSTSDPNNPSDAEFAYWHVASNWDNGVPTCTLMDPCNPTNETGKAVFYYPLSTAECWVTTADACCWYFVMGDNEPMMAPCRIKDGGTLTTGNNWSGISYSHDAHVIVEEGGTLNCGQHLWIGMGNGGRTGTGTLTINGGTVNVNTAFDIGRGATAGGLVSVNSGLLSVEHVTVPTGSGWYMYDGGVVDVSFGTFQVHRNLRSWSGVDLIAAQIASGQLTAFGGLGTVDDVYVDSWTIITGGADPLARTPTWDALVPSTNLTLSWANLDPNNLADDVWVDVWFGTDPNNPHQWTKVSSGTPNETSAVIGGAPTAAYLWQINSYLYGDPAIKVYDCNDLDPDSCVQEGLLMPFETTDDFPPTVVIDSNDILTWVGRIVTLTATITDEGASQVFPVWSSVNEPNIIFTNPTWNPGTGIATVQVSGDSHQSNSPIVLTVTDATNPGDPDSDTVVVDVAMNPCHAARAGWPRMDLVYTADFDEDCDIDLTDLLVVVRQWLDPYALEEPLQL